MVCYGVNIWHNTIFCGNILQVATDNQFFRIFFVTKIKVKFKLLYPKENGMIFIWYPTRLYGLPWGLFLGQLRSLQLRNHSQSKLEFFWKHHTCRAIHSDQSKPVINKKKTYANSQKKDGYHILLPLWNF